MEPELTGEKTPLRDLIRRLLEKDPGRRISCDGVKQHEVFRGVDWSSVLRISRPPFIPAAADWEEEGAEGNNPIDVEECVQEIFRNGNGNDNDNRSAVSKVAREGIPDGNRDDEGSIDPSSTTDFSVF